MHFVNGEVRLRPIQTDLDLDFILEFANSQEIVSTRSVKDFLLKHRVSPIGSTRIPYNLQLNCRIDVLP